jgi:hypothetical protein
MTSGKLHAVLSRSWCKGRDLYDLVWYLADSTWPEPNLFLLNSALSQTSWAGEEVVAGNWRKVLLDKLEGIDWEEARTDVLPFLERPREVELIRPEHLSRLLKWMRPGGVEGTGQPA